MRAALTCLSILMMRASRTATRPEVYHTQIAFGAARGRNTVSDENLTWKDAATLPIVFGEFPAP